MKQEAADDHNDAKYLAITYRWTRAENKEGWIVMRTCPCHHGERVTMHYRTQDQAKHARTVILEATL